MMQFLLFVLIVVSADFARANPNFVIIQPQPSLVIHEVDVHYSRNVINPFYDANIFGLGYRFHIDRELSWNLASLELATSSYSDIDRHFKDDFMVIVPRPPRLLGLVTTELTYTPLTFKWSFFNQFRIWSSASFDFGIGRARWSSGEDTNLSILGIHFSFDLGHQRKISWGLKNLVFNDKVIEPEFLVLIGYHWGFHEK